MESRLREAIGGWPLHGTTPRSSPAIEANPGSASLAHDGDNVIANIVGRVSPAKVVKIATHFDSNRSRENRDGRSDECAQSQSRVTEVNPEGSCTGAGRQEESGIKEGAGSPLK